eukprot:TRINITY_DN5357_c0_g1_i1.p1 TRINITY_DN5357_c0_g1~~TRINITY_DN5357_c0_g1_i1.p1  ORF type:complete len:503 (+),score=41.29 TRINITY_DN5357_c0_g1_i1:97-1509(+)
MDNLLHDFSFERDYYGAAVDYYFPSDQTNAYSPDAWHPFVRGFVPAWDSKLTGLQGIALLAQDTTKQSVTLQALPPVYGLWQSTALDDTGPSLSNRIPATLFKTGMTLSLWTRWPDAHQPVYVDIDVTYNNGHTVVYRQIITNASYSTALPVLAPEELIYPSGHDNAVDMAEVRDFMWNERWICSCGHIIPLPVPISTITMYIYAFLTPDSSTSQPTVYIDHATLAPYVEQNPGVGECQELSAVSTYAQPSICERIVGDAHSKEHACSHQVIPMLYSPPTQVQGSVALLTHLFLNDLEALDKLAQSWQGPISATLFVHQQTDVNTLTTDSTAFDRLLARFSHIQQYASIHLVYPTSEDNHSGNEPLALLWGVARDNTQATFVIYVPVHYIPCANMPRTLSEIDLTKTQQQIKQQSETVIEQVAYVIHSFVSSSPIDASVLHSKDELINLYKQDLLLVSNLICDCSFTYSF